MLVLLSLPVLPYLWAWSVPLECPRSAPLRLAHGLKADIRMLTHRLVKDNELRQTKKSPVANVYKTFYGRKLSLFI